jgi:hypothetical protein
MSSGRFEIRLGPQNGNGDHQTAPRDEPQFRQDGERGLHRYCSSCSQETEHVLCVDGPKTPAIRRPSVEPASGTTMCVDCGQWRSPAARPDAPVWSFWPRPPGEADGVASVRVSRRER